jgi:phosphatidylglycerophosphatase A
MKTIGRAVATFFGLGFFPLAPGTAASLAVVLIYKFFLGGLLWPYVLLLFFLFTVLGVISSADYSRELREEDPRKIVIDEACGQLFVLLLVPPTWAALAVSFFLFRFFDIIKPFPVSRAEKLPGGWGIMADDFVAAGMAKILVHLYLVLK